MAHENFGWHVTELKLSFLQVKGILTERSIWYLRGSIFLLWIDEEIAA